MATLAGPPDIEFLGYEEIVGRHGRVRRVHYMLRGYGVWCRVAIRGGIVTGFGGSVWPDTWPDLFRLRLDEQPGSYDITPLGQRMLDEAGAS